MRLSLPPSPFMLVFEVLIIIVKSQTREQNSDATHTFLYIQVQAQSTQHLPACHGVLYPGSAILPHLVTGLGRSADPRLSVPQGGSSPNLNPFGLRCLESGTAISSRQGLGKMPAYWNARGLPYRRDTNLTVPVTTGQHSIGH